MVGLLIHLLRISSSSVSVSHTPLASLPPFSSLSLHSPPAAHRSHPNPSVRERGRMELHVFYRALGLSLVGGLSTSICNPPPPPPWLAAYLSPWRWFVACSKFEFPWEFACCLLVRVHSACGWLDAFWLRIGSDVWASDPTCQRLHVRALLE
jgi:hypothetical protein